MPHAGLALSARESPPQAITAVDLPMKKAANCMSLAAFVMRFGECQLCWCGLNQNCEGKQCFSEHPLCPESQQVLTRLTTQAGIELEFRQDVHA